MKRDDDLVRKLLFAIETAEFTSHVANPVIEGYDEETVDHHVYLMWQEGLVEAIDANTLSSGPHKRAAARALTWKGHDAVAVLRDDTVWAKTKATVAKAGGATLPMILEVAAGFLKERLGLKP